MWPQTIQNSGFKSQSEFCGFTFSPAYKDLSERKKHVSGVYTVSRAPVSHHCKCALLSHVCIQMCGCGSPKLVVFGSSELMCAGQACDLGISEDPSHISQCSITALCPDVAFFLVFLSFSGPHLRHMEVPRLGVQSELWLPAYARAPAMQDPSCICNLHPSSQQCWINLLSKARD